MGAPDRQQRLWSGTLLAAFLLGFLLVELVVLPLTLRRGPEHLPYSRFLALVDRGRVERVVITE